MQGVCGVLRCVGMDGSTDGMYFGGFLWGLRFTHPAIVSGRAMGLCRSSHIFTLLRARYRQKQKADKAAL